MEHLPLPRDPIKPHPKIRLASAQFAKPGPFLEYEERHGQTLRGNYPHVPTQIEFLSGRAGPNSAAISSQEVIDYYQGWLFFSLLAEFLGPIFEPEIYVEGESGIKAIWLTTKHLHEDLAVLRLQVPLAMIEADDEYHRHLESCLDLVFNAFDDIERSFSGFTKAFSDDMICFASVAEVLDAAVATAVDLFAA
ncbi:hypothetical protein OQA88_8266 [Cercophora sp. LCS_1]